MIGAPVGAPPKNAGFRSLRTRITAWNIAIIALCLVIYSIAVGVSYAAHVATDWDRSAHEDIELAARAIVLDGNGVPSWPGGLVWKPPNEEPGEDRWIEVWGSGGRRLLATGVREPPDLGPPDPASVDHGARTLVLPAGPFRVLSERFERGRSSFVVRAAISEAPGRKEIRSLWSELGLLSLAVLSFGGLGGYVLMRRSLGPLARMADHARRITAEHLHERLSLEDSGAELNQLRDAFNDTLARLERSFAELRSFTANASHELRTPLTALRSVGEVGLQRARSGPEYRELIGTMLEEVDGLSRLVDGLLTLARADAGQSRLTIEELDLSSLASEVADRLSVLAEERGQTLETRTNEPVIVRGDRLALRHALINLVDNAIKYAPEGTRVRVRVGREAAGAVVEVQDEGPGISSEHRARIFERFYRVDGSRSREMGGTGLGLSIVKGAAEAHGGWVELVTEEGRGSTFRLVLPDQGD